MQNLDNLLIEKIDKSRYKFMKWLTVGWTFWFGGFIVKDFIGNKLILGATVVVGLVGWILFIINLIMFIKIGKIVKNNDLKNVLNDEFTVYNRNKSFVIGFWTFLILTGVFLGLSLYTDISSLIICEVTLFIGTVSTLISSLVYNNVS